MLSPVIKLAKVLDSEQSRHIHTVFEKLWDGSSDSDAVEENSLSTAEVTQHLFKQKPTKPN